MANSPNARQILEKHWDTFITEDDFAYIASKGINTVRIPVSLDRTLYLARSHEVLTQIGFYHLCAADPGVLDDTDFSHLKNVYEGAWARITNAIALASKHELGVLIGTVVRCEAGADWVTLLLRSPCCTGQAEQRCSRRSAGKCPVSQAQEEHAQYD
jgi:hypothetical protein